MGESLGKEDEVLTAGDEEFTEEETSEEPGEQVETTEGPDETYLTQDDFDRAIRRKHAQWERGLARRLGFKSVDEALPYVRAGQVVSERAGVAPTDVVHRLSGQPQEAPVGMPVATGPQIGTNPLEQRLNRIEGLLEDDRTAKLLKSQEAEARKEFGDLYDKYREDIEDKADELGLPLADAAAVVLRSKLVGHYESQTRTKQQTQRRRKVEGSGDAPGTGKPDYATVLSPAQREAAKRTGVSLERYYAQLKRLGRIK